MKQILYSFLFVFSVKVVFGQIQYHTNSSNDLIEIYTDRNEYIAGETIWFKVIQINGFEEGEQSKIVYIELINYKGFSAQRRKIFIESGLGYGDFSLSDTLSTGNYKIIAYTNWMKNFDLPVYYEKDISVYNPLKTNDIGLPGKADSKLLVSFDGNEIVNNLQNTVYYYIQGSLLNHGEIAIKNKQGEILFNKQTDEASGKIVFTPAVGEEYNLFFSTSDTILISKIPHGVNEGIIFGFEGGDNDSVSVNIYCTNYIETNLKRIFYSINNSSINKRIDLNSKNHLAVSYKEFKNGKNSIKFFKDDGALLWERTFFVNRKIEEINIDKSSFRHVKKREIKKVMISLAENSSHDWANVAVSIKKIQTPEAVDYTKENGISCNGELSVEMINNFFAFNVFKNNSNSQYLPEFKGSLIKGQIIDKDGIPMSHSEVFLSYVDSVVRLNITQTNESGEFVFFIKQNIPIREIVINTNSEKKDLVILIYNNFLNEYNKFLPNKNIINDSAYKNFLDELYLNFRINKLYELSNSVNDNLLPSSYLKTGFYEKPDRTFEMDKFVRLDSIHEYFYEIIGEVRVLRHNKQRYFRVFNKKTSTLYKNDPALFVDGVYIDDPQIVFDLDPNDCKRIEVIQKPVLLKNKVYDGLIAVFTYKNNLPVKLSSNTSRIEYELFNKSVKFQNENNQDLRIPYFKNTLYWNPGLVLTRNNPEIIEFLTGDTESWYEIIIKGYTNNGQKVIAREVFKVTE